jgi:hypothetical protein
MFRILTCGVVLIAAGIAGGGCREQTHQTSRPPVVARGPVAAAHDAEPGESTPHRAPEPRRPPWSFDGSVAAPPLPGPSTPPAAAAAALCRYLDWLYADHPDPALASEFALVGSEPQRRIAAELHTLALTNRREFDDAAVHHVVVLESRHAGEWRVRVDDSPGATNTIDPAGERDRRVLPEGFHWIGTLEVIDGHWRFVSIVAIDPPAVGAGTAS